VMLASFLIAGVTVLAHRFGWFWYFVLGESLLALVLYVAMRRSMVRAGWEPIP
jgi:hypothetical protein